MELSVNENDAKEVTNFYERRGITGMYNFLVKKRDEWIDIPVHIALCGSSGTGKSSFINSIRGLKAEDKNGAVLNVGDSTIEPIPYSHPNKHYLKFWDLPRLCSMSAFTKDKYLRNINFDKYDFFLIFTQSSYTEDDLWFIEKLQSADKKHFFLRTFIDTVMDKAIQESNPSEPEEFQKQILGGYRNDLVQQIKNAKLKCDYVYLMNTYDTRRYDFPKLAYHMIDCLPERKWEALALTIHVLGEDVIKSKRRALQKRLWILAILSNLDNAAHIYGLPYDLDVEVVTNEAQEYRHQFGLDDGAMLCVARSIDTTIDNLKKASSFKTNYTQIADGGLVTNYKTLTVFADIAEGITKSFSPILGSLITGNSSFGSTYYVLNKLLDMMETDALRMIEYVKYRDAIF